MALWFARDDTPVGHTQAYRGSKPTLMYEDKKQWAVAQQDGCECIGNIDPSIAEVLGLKRGSVELIALKYDYGKE